MARDRAALARSVLERAERRRGLREAPRRRSRAIAKPIDRLKELYAKRRAYKPLYDLLAHEAEAAPEGAERRELWMEMAKLAAERLDMGAQAVALHKRVLDEEPSSAAALDALEKQAERDKDFATVAEVLERRTALARRCRGPRSRFS